MPGQWLVTNREVTRHVDDIAAAAAAEDGALGPRVRVDGADAGRAAQVAREVDLRRHEVNDVRSWGPPVGGLGDAVV